MGDSGDTPGGVTQSLARAPAGSLHPLSGSGVGPSQGGALGLGPRPSAPLPWTILCTEGAGQHPGPPRRTPPSMASLLSFKHLLSSEYVIVQSVFDKAGQDSLKQASTGLSKAGSCVLNSAPGPGGPVRPQHSFIPWAAGLGHVLCGGLVASSSRVPKAKRCRPVIQR